MEFYFPFDEPRKVQKAFLVQVASALEQRQSLLVHAPTGIGKTAASLCGVLQTALEKKKTIFFLASRHTQHHIAVETLKKIKEKHKLPLHVVDFIGKKQMCQQSGVEDISSGEFGEYCRALREGGTCSYFNNLKSNQNLSVHAQLVIQQLERATPMHVEEMHKLCREQEVCTYEIAGMFGKQASVFIADYNHLLHPSIRDSLFKRIQKSLSDCIVIFDECHNLPERARNLLSSTLTSLMVDFSVKEARQAGFGEIADMIMQVGDVLQVLVQGKLAVDKDEAFVEKREFSNMVRGKVDYDELIGHLRIVGDAVLETRKRSFCNSLSLFLESWTGPDDGFVRILSREITKSGKVVFTLAYKCLDPSLVVAPFINECFAVMGMSGTLTPVEMYRDVLGFRKEKTITVEYENPFPKENRLTLIVPETSTKFTVRSGEMYQLIAKKCLEITEAVPGNSVLFFPSYYILDEVYHYFKNESTRTSFIERPGLLKEEKGEMLERFKSYKDTGAVLFGVSTGSFGEGIDLIGDFLKCVVVIGIPLTKPDLETQKLIEYYDAKFKKGWEYGYLYPAIIHVLQNAGRCIRSETDRGVMLFLDERYLWQNYLRCFPKDWQMKVSVRPSEQIHKFFQVTEAQKI